MVVRSASADSTAALCIASASPGTSGRSVIVGASSVTSRGTGERSVVIWDICLLSSSSDRGGCLCRVPSSDPIIALLEPVPPLFTTPTWKKMLPLLPPVGDCGKRQCRASLLLGGGVLPIPALGP